jgi:hypothetical protein
MAVAATRSTSPFSLGYEPRARTPWRRVRRLVTTSTIVGTLAAAGWYWGPSFYRQAGYLYWQHKSMNWSPPADMIVYEENAERATALVTTGNGYYFPQWSGRERPAAAHVPPPMRTLSSGWVALVFVHRRTTPSGEERLAHVGLQANSGEVGELRRIQIYGLGRVPATWWPGSTAETVPNFQSGGFDIYLTAEDQLRLFAGQADPTIPSRFTIDYELNGERDRSKVFCRTTARRCSSPADRSSIVCAPRGRPGNQGARGAAMGWRWCVSFERPQSAGQSGRSNFFFTFPVCSL